MCQHGLEFGVWSMAFNIKLGFHKQKWFSQTSLLLNLKPRVLNPKISTL